MEYIYHKSRKQLTFLLPPVAKLQTGETHPRTVGRPSRRDVTCRRRRYCQKAGSRSSSWHGCARRQHEFCQDAAVLLRDFQSISFPQQVRHVATPTGTQAFPTGKQAPSYNKPMRNCGHLFLLSGLCSMLQSENIDLSKVTTSHECCDEPNNRGVRARRSLKLMS